MCVCVCVCVLMGMCVCVCVYVSGVKREREKEREREERDEGASSKVLRGRSHWSEGEPREEGQARAKRNVSARVCKKEKRDRAGERKQSEEEENEDETHMDHRKTTQKN